MSDIKHKFLFVVCVTDEDMYLTCRKHVGRLHVPLGGSMSIHPIYGATSLASGYNQVLENDAKYKIYLHQDTCIMNRNFLNDILELFQDNPKLGMLGMVGCTKLHKSGNWWMSKEHLVGKYIKKLDRVYHLERWKEIEESFAPVEAVDGFLMATQYNIPWREDLFKRFHMYDASQCMEFRKKGYLVGVPKQIEPWCFHFYTGSNYSREDYKREQEIFLQNYSDMIDV